MVSYSDLIETGLLLVQEMCIRDRVEDDQFSVRIWLRDPLIFGTTQIEGAEGTTGSLPSRELTYVQAPGTTWAPASLFQMLGYTVTLDGTTLNIQ